ILRVQPPARLGWVWDPNAQLRLPKYDGGRGWAAERNACVHRLGLEPQALPGDPRDDPVIGDLDGVLVDVVHDRVAVTVPAVSRVGMQWVAVDERRQVVLAVGVPRGVRYIRLNPAPISIQRAAV